ELSLDLYYFKRMWKVNSVKLAKKERELVEKVMGVEIDIMNLIWIFRVKRFYDVPDEIIYSYIIPIHYKLSREEIKNLISAKGVEGYLDAVNKTDYKGFFDDVKDSPTGIIRKYWKTVYSINKKSERQNAFSLAPILAYMDYKDIEIRNIITVIEAVHYEMEPKEIMSRLIIVGGKGGTENGDS
ncbi:MAG: V-type ATPase subunit, partial [Clostridia bacterium]